MLEIQIAGAGAGKTFGLAKKIASRLTDQTIPRKIFALTYTNSAKLKIETALIKEIEIIPENVIVETVHSFLLNEIIFPFSGYVLGDRYNKSSVYPLGSNLKFKAINIKKLKEKAIIYIEEVYSVSKQIVDRENKKHSSKEKKGKVDRILALLTECVDSIFVDEVQDLDPDALRFFEVLGNNVLVHLIGDPKQAIKYSNAFSDFIEKHRFAENENNAKSLSINNLTRRVPREILKISNRFCYENQEQESSNPSAGTIRYIESSNNEFATFLINTLKNGGIVCIDKKNGRYNTNTKKEYQFPFKVEEKIANSMHGKDDELIVRSALKEFQHNCQIHAKTTAINLLAKQFKISFEKDEFAQLYELYNLFQIKSDSTFKVTSIDAVKGLEADSCILILTPNTYRYLIQNISLKEERFNKEWKKIYVALTRTKRELVFALDHALFKESELLSIRDNLELLGAIEII